MSSSVVPSLMVSVAQRSIRDIRSKIGMALQFTMLIAMPCGIGFTVLGQPILNMLYPNLEGHGVAVRLMLFSLLTIGTFSFSTITNAILQGIDHMRTPIVNSAISLGIHLVLLPLVLILLKWNIYGVIVCDCFFALLVCILNQRAITRYTGYRIDVKRTMAGPLAASLLMGLVVSGCYWGLMAIFPHNTVVTLFSVLLGIAVYGISIIRLHIVTEAELAGMPKGTVLIRAAKKLHLL